MRINKKKKSFYSPSDAVLPSTYLELFFDTVKQNWRTIIGIGLLTFVFFLPALAANFGKDLYFLKLTTSTYTQEEIDALRITSRNLFNIGVAVGIVIASIGISGLSRVNLLVSREEGYYFFQDFNKGIKQNLKSNFVFFLIYGALIYLSFLVINNINARYVAFIPLAIVQTLFFPLILINIETTSVYSWTIKDSFRNATFVYIKNFILIFLFSLLYSSVLLLNLITYIYLKYLLIFLLVVLIYPFINVGLRVYFNKILDRDINKEHYPEIYMMGIYEHEEDQKIIDGLTKYYGQSSTYSSIRNDPYLSSYYYHLCNYVSNEKDIIMAANEAWPKQDVIDSLNYLRGLSFARKLFYLEKKDYSALGLIQKEKSKVAIVMAGGGYGSVCSLHEELPVSVELYKKGFTVFSFVYPVKEKSKLSNKCLRSFIKYLFNNEKQMNINMSNYIVIGFSAGAHLAASIATDNYGIKNDQLPNPKLIGLCYPVITFNEYAEKGTLYNFLGDNHSQEERDDFSIEKHVTDDYPNVFIWACNKDSAVPFENSLLMVESLKKHNIDYRFEEFDSDVHGWALANGTLAEGWLDRLVNYFVEITKE